MQAVWNDVVVIVNSKIHLDIHRTNTRTCINYYLIIRIAIDTVEVLSSVT